MSWIWNNFLNPAQPIRMRQVDVPSILMPVSQEAYGVSVTDCALVTATKWAVSGCFIGEDDPANVPQPSQA